MIWELGVRIDPRKFRVVPFRYFAQKDSGEGLGRKFEFRRYAWNVVGWYVGTQNCREVEDIEPTLRMVLFEFTKLHRGITCAEIVDASCNFSDTSARTDRIVFNLDIWMKLLIFSEPFRVHRIWECGPTSRQQCLPLGCALHYTQSAEALKQARQTILKGLGTSGRHRR